MRKIIITSVLILITVFSFCQTPNGFNYQAVLRNSSGEILANQAVDIEISIIDENSGGTVLYTETHTKTTNAYGLVSLIVGGETPDYGVFEDINWAVNDKFIQVKVDETDMGTFQLLTVPFAMHAASATNLGSENVYTGTDTLFVVKDAEGNPVFVVFPDGAKVIVEEATKGTVGGFAVSGRSPTKADETEIFHVTPDSTRIFVNDTVQSKGTVGGFAVSGRSPTKGISKEYLVVTQDSTRVYISDTTLAKGTVGGFAVSGRSPTKAETKDYFNISGNQNADTINNEPRVMWYPKKAAFLAGEVHVGSADSVGTNSTALGYRTIAMGDQSQAFGFESKAFGDYSTAIGKNAVASSENSFAFGNEAKGLNLNAYAFGKGAVASGAGSYALGSEGEYAGTIRQTMATGTSSLAVGLGAIASNTGATAIGFYNEASGEYSTAMGLDTRATGYNSFAAGHGSLASGWYSTAFGENCKALNYRSFVAGYNSTSSGEVSIALGMECKATGTNSFAVGRKSSATGIYSTALGRGMTVSGTGSFGIGLHNVNVYSLIQAFTMSVMGGVVGIATLTPSYTLEVNGTAGKPGGGSWSNSSDIRLKDINGSYEKGLSEILKLNPVSFNYKKDNARNLPSDEEYVGFIAQDAQVIFPETVHTGDDGYLDFNMHAVNVAMVNAIKEQQTQIEELKSENEELKARLDEIEKLLLNK